MYQCSRFSFVMHSGTNAARGGDVTWSMTTLCDPKYKLMVSQCIHIKYNIFESVCMRPTYTETIQGSSFLTLETTTWCQKCPVLHHAELTFHVVFVLNPSLS
ncbi:hypothetical protein OUZ56_033335 [Daphnia magna]|uniref:Uncharacterized protein n=1 Tax=Daphnia magna TaxID=35525 RepID=A0ABR0BAM2_9CRUS|nr:hypothetical protein OUZ56_033335 [Daphnia magna]